VITNSLPVFQSFQSRADHFSLQLIGGRYRPRSGAFIGSLANEVLRRLRTDKAFVSVNGLDEQVLSNANTEEGETQRIALTNAGRRYAVADHSKLNRRDFYGFYDTSQLDGIVTDPQITNNDYTKYRHLTAVFSKPKK
jgi:DeoR family lactose phosphotransferase system repressor